MGNQYISSGKINLLPLQNSLYSCRITLRRLSAKDLAHISRLQKWKQPEIRFTKLICQSNLFQTILFFLRSLTRNINLMASKQTTGIIKPLCRIMISRYNKNRNHRFNLSQSCQEFIKQADCFCRRHGFIINVSCDNNCIRMYGRCI